MRKLEWAAIATVVVIGIVSQIPHHDHEELPGHTHDYAAVSGAHTDGAETVTLAVSGMT